MKCKYLSTYHERDTETDWDYRGARFYDGDIGRFLSLDPLAADYPAWSDYNYVMGNPVILVDPDGKTPLTALIGGAIGLGFGIWEATRQPGGFSWDAATLSKIGVRTATGALIGSGVGVVGAGLISAGGEAAAQGVDLASNKREDFNYKTVAVSGALGAGGNLLGSKIATSTFATRLLVPRNTSTSLNPILGGYSFPKNDFFTTVTAELSIGFGTSLLEQVTGDYINPEIENQGNQTQGLDNCDSLCEPSKDNKSILEPSILPGQSIFTQ